MAVRSIFRHPIALLVLLLMLVPLVTGSSMAAPFTGADQTRSAQLNVDWMTADQARSLDLDFPVLVPSWVPAPFGGSPSIQGGGGYYSLYWMIPGGEPTFLQITGEVGGAMPVGSPADLNVRLSINSSINGYDAIHDVTAIYDNVWWIQGGVLYTVSSRNMTGADTVSLASSLVPLQQPTADDPTPTPVPPTPVPPTPTPVQPTGEIYNATSVPAANIAIIEAWPSASSTLRATGGTFAASGAAFIATAGAAHEWVAPSVDQETMVEFSLVDDATGTVTSWSSIRVYPETTTVPTNPTPTNPPPAEPTPVPPTPTTAPPQAPAVEPTPTTAPTVSVGSVSEADGTGAALSSTTTMAVTDASTTDPTPTSTAVAGSSTTSDGTEGPSLLRTGDGTAGPNLPAGSDGTGGIRQIAVP